MPNPGRQSVLFPALLSKSVSVAFDEPTSTSDGGALLVATVFLAGDAWWGALTVSRLKQIDDLPVSWAEQRKLLLFSQ